MNSTIRRIIKAAILASVFVFLTGCNFSNQFSVNAVAKEPVKKTAWLAYWELDDGIKDLKKVEKKLDQLCYFGTYFDNKDRIFMPQELSDKFAESNKSKGRYTTYLTFINDRQNADESFVLKDVEVLRRIFSSDASMDNHIDEIIALTKQGGFDGIEIDYEKIWSDEKVGKDFVRFIDKLFSKSLENNLKLRVVLEPGTPFSTAKFSQGPEYVVMLYNLYGLHSTPGPKANKDFIQKTIAKMCALPGEKSVAFATGGCLWGSNGERRLLTEVEAKTLATTHGATTVRDEKSQCVVFSYKDKGISHIVWFADVKTLKYWIAIAQEQGVSSVSLWRLGGNVNINDIQ